MAKQQNSNNSLIPLLSLDYVQSYNIPLYYHTIFDIYFQMSIRF